MVTARVKPDEPDSMVFLAESEKSADALRQVGLRATTSTDGLEGAVVAVLLPSDDPDRARAQRIATGLVGIATSVTRVDLGLATGQDIHEWLGSALADDDLADGARRLVIDIAVRYRQAGFTRHTLNGIECLVYDNLCAYSHGRTATEIANRTKGGIGVRRSRVEEAVRWLVASGAVVASRGRPGRPSLARVFRPVRDTLGHDGTSLGSVGGPS